MNRLKFIFILLIATQLKAQNVLPDFSVSVLTESKARIYWKQSFANCTQITIQKSYDSLKHFKTIFSSLSPELPENAYVDNDYLPELKIYYRILYVIDEGNYFFTKSKTPNNKNFSNNLINTNRVTEPIKSLRLITIDKPLITNKEFEIISTEPKKIRLLDSIIVTPLPKKRMFAIYFRQADSLYKILDDYSFSKFKDSIINKTKDTLYAYENDIIVWKPFIPDPAWQASDYVYTSPKGYVIIQIPNFKKHKYRLVCFDDNKEEVLRIKHINSNFLMLEKSNFIKAGWYSFELYEDDKLKEKNKFQLIADF